MKKLRISSVFIAALLIVASCCKKELNNAPCALCPLSDGSMCPIGMFNIGGSCACPEGSIEFNNQCIGHFGNNNTPAFAGEVNCFCLDRFFIQFFDENEYGWAAAVQKGDFSRVMGEAIGGASFTGNSHGFNLWLLPFGLPDQFDCFYDGGEYTIPRISGFVENDSLYFNIYFHQGGAVYNTPIDSCVGYVFPRL